MERSVRLECAVKNEGYGVTVVKTSYFNMGYDRENHEWIIAERVNGPSSTYTVKKNALTDLIFCSAEECRSSLLFEKERARMAIEKAEYDAGIASGDFPEFSLMQGKGQVDRSYQIVVNQWVFPRDVCKEGLIFDDCKEGGHDIFYISYTYEITCDIVDVNSKE